MADGVKPVEIRVHGIGEHVAWSSLGSPPLRKPRVGRAPETVEPPVLPDHELRLVNWSRTSRGSAGLLWYVALPYTLINTAGYMEPDAGRLRRGLHRIAVTVVGLVLTVCTYLWGVVLLETLARRLPIDETSDPTAGVMLALLTGVALSLGMWWRVKERKLLKEAPGLLIAHIAMVVGATLLALLRPAHWEWDAPSWLGWLTTLGPTSNRRCQEEGVCAIAAFDPVTALAVGSFIVALLLALLVVGAGAFGARSAKAPPTDAPASVPRRNAGAAGVAGLALAASVLLLHSVASALRLFLDNATAYLGRHELLFTSSTASFDGRGVLPGLLREQASRDDYLIDVLPLAGIIAVLAYGLAVLLVSALHRNGPRRYEASHESILCKPERARWVHRVVSRLAWILPAISLVACVLFAIGVAAIIETLSDRDETPWLRAVAVIQAISVLTAALVLSGRGGSARRLLSRVADVLGFWAVRYHPLGGACYRDEVVPEIRMQLAEAATAGKRTALVGHSQGSVLVAWAVGGPDLGDNPEEQPGLLLVTCGSPLRSLYGTFFPTHFNDGFFTHVEGIARGGWSNFWRETDPIATSLSIKGDQRLDDPDDDGRLRGHSDYWTDGCQVKRIEDHLKRT